MDNILIEKGGKTICWRKLNSNDWENVKKLAKEQFLPNEPLAACLESNNISVHNFCIKEAEKTMSNNISIGTYDQNDDKQLCGISLLSITRPSLDAKNGSKPPANHILPRFFSFVSKNLQDHIGNESYIMIEISTVHQNYTKMGIMSNLRKKINLIAAEQNCRYIVSISSSKYTQMIGAKLGYKVLNEVFYSDYVDQELGIKPFKDLTDKHRSAKLLCLDLKQT